MPLQLQPGDAAALATLPEIARRAITADLEAKQHAREQAEQQAAARAHAEASRAAHPVHKLITEQNARVAAQPPRPRPAPAPAGLSRLDAQSYARSPAVQHIAAFNDRDVAAAQAKQAAESLARVERLEAQAAAMQAAAQVEEQRAAAVARTGQLERALIAMAEKYIKQHPDV